MFKNKIESSLIKDKITGKWVLQLKINNKTLSFDANRAFIAISNRGLK